MDKNPNKGDPNKKQFPMGNSGVDPLQDFPWGLEVGNSAVDPLQDFPWGLEEYTSLFDSPVDQSFLGGGSGNQFGQISGSGPGPSKHADPPRNRPWLSYSGPASGSGQVPTRPVGVQRFGGPILGDKRVPATAPPLMPVPMPGMKRPRSSTAATSGSGQVPSRPAAAATQPEIWMAEFDSCVNRLARLRNGISAAGVFLIPLSEQWTNEFMALVACLVDLMQRISRGGISRGGISLN